MKKILHKLILPLLISLCGLLLSGLARASVIAVPELIHPPSLEAFLQDPHSVDSMARIEGFIQREPHDGAPATQQTVVWVGYDRDHIYFLFLATDTDPAQVRARMSRRERIEGDDMVEVMLDTFGDQRRAYVFRTNAFGIQWDALWTEGSGFDTSFDTVWHSQGRLTADGFAVLMAIPMKSLRFPPEAAQRWGLILGRQVQRGQNEESFWPRVSSRIQGRLNQAGVLTGIEAVSPGRNAHAIPYGSFRSFNLREAPGTGEALNFGDTEADGGLDFKTVFKDSFVLDLTANPDFSQVESDEPQVTVNQRFEVFFPERRPFFLENADFFSRTLLFTRRIRDPQFGARLTGKRGKWALGMLAIDDESPGKLVPEDDPLEGRRALFTAIRLGRDVFDQSNLGLAYVGREFGTSYNRVGGMDGRFRLGQNWATDLQLLASDTRDQDGSTSAGPLYSISWERSGRQFNYFGRYRDVGSDFKTEAGFVNRTGIRDTFHFLSYLFRPEGERFIAWGFEFLANRIWDRNGTRLDDVWEGSVEWHFAGQTSMELNYQISHELLRPEDFSRLNRSRDFKQEEWVVEFETSFSDLFSIDSDFGWGKKINFTSPAGSQPDLASWNQGRLNLSVRPLETLTIDNTYLFTRLGLSQAGPAIFNNHILRSRWNWQLNRELSLRFITQYDGLITSPQYTRLDTRKNLNLDVLATYLINPWTALFVGYNSNLRNSLDFFAHPRERRFLNDGRQFFIKVSYLFQF